MKKIFVLSFLLLITLPMLAGCGENGGLVVKDAWARPGISGGNGGVFFTLKNPTSSVDKIIHADSIVAEAVELHQTTMDDGVMKMSPQEFVEVPAKSTVEFAPGGLHVMLIGLAEDLAVGDTFQVTLEFQNHDPIQMNVTVLEP